MIIKLKRLRKYKHHKNSITLLETEQNLEVKCGIIKENCLPELPKKDKEIITKEWEGFCDLDIQEESNIKKRNKYLNS